MARHLASGVAALLILLANASHAEGSVGLIWPALATGQDAGWSSEGLRVAHLSLSIGSPDCAMAQGPQQRQTPARRRHSRMFGWLWRSTRNVDIERTGAPLLFYLRSPLLTTIPDRSECPDELAEHEPNVPAACASLAVNPGQDDAYSVAVTLPQLAASSPAKLAATLRDRLDRGERVTLRALGGAEIELSPERIRQVQARTCVADA
jgi:hypothetical protein